ncbi:unnamed protein product [Scytosiphon promiscuus]
MIELVLKAWDDEIGSLVAAGVTGRILLANVGSPKGLVAFSAHQTRSFSTALPKRSASGLRNWLPSIPPKSRCWTSTLCSRGRLLSKALQQNRVRSQTQRASAQHLTPNDLIGVQALMDEPSIFEDLGFTLGEGEEGLLAESCIQFDFFVDSTAEIMGTQALRNPDCQEECALCADSVSPCQNYFVGTQPGITKCDDPSNKIFYDGIHFTTDFHLLFGEAVRQCSKDNPNFDRPFVQVLCPAEHTA